MNDELRNFLRHSNFEQHAGSLERAGYDDLGALQTMAVHDGFAKELAEDTGIPIGHARLFRRLLSTIVDAPGAAVLQSPGRPATQANAVDPEDEYNDRSFAPEPKVGYAGKDEEPKLPPSVVCEFSVAQAGLVNSSRDEEPEAEDVPGSTSFSAAVMDHELQIRSASSIGYESEANSNAVDQQSVPSLLSHIIAHEQTPLDCLKALRALASFAYTDALLAGHTEKVLQQVLRLIELHRANQIFVRVLLKIVCNIAYNPYVASDLIAKSKIYTPLLGLAAMHENSRDVTSSASEIVARILLATRKMLKNGSRRTEVLDQLRVFIDTPLNSSREVAAMGVMLSDLITSEVVTVEEILVRLQAVARAAYDCANTATHWLSLIRQLVVGGVLPPGSLLALGSMGVVVSLSERFCSHVATQHAAIKAMCELAGSGWDGLKEFVDVRGLQRIEVALEQHGSDVEIQASGLRVLSAAMEWPKSVQLKSNFSSERAVRLATTAVAAHMGSADLLVAALELLAKYLERTHGIKGVLADGHAIQSIVNAARTQSLSITHHNAIAGNIHTAKAMGQDSPKLEVIFELPDNYQKRTVGGIVRGVTFTRAPLGMIYQKGPQLTVNRVRRKSHSHELGVENGWTIRVVDGSELKGKSFHDAEKIFLGGVSKLPQGGAEQVC